MKRPIMKIISLIATLLLSLSCYALNVGDTVPAFKLSDQNGNIVDGQSFKNKWTILFFYPKADTPGCTKQACAFRDNSTKITNLGAQIYGISVNSVKDQKKFFEKYKLNFPLLADEDAEVAKLFKVKRPLIDIAKRWTFIIGPENKVMDIGEDVDPVLDSERVINKLKELQKR